MWLVRFYRSTIGKKIIMAVTGLIGVGFVIGHMAGNLQAFVGAPPEGAVACHNNGNGYDNRVVNLRWDTRKANALDAVRHGMHPRQLAKLPDAGTLRLYLQHMSLREVAKWQGVRQEVIRRVLNRDM